MYVVYANIVMCVTHNLCQGHPVKQADTVMLGYPLGLPMTPEVRRNDLEAYEPVTDPGGPAMAWVNVLKVDLNPV